jgi:hypothetical protein
LAGPFVSCDVAGIGTEVSQDLGRFGFHHIDCQ